jgi:hypothetical protein
MICSPVPPLGGNVPPALDRMFQRARAKSPEDRWGTALELAAALRVVFGVGASRSDLPRIDRDDRDAWLAEAPPPLAESIAELDAAHNAHQTRDLAEELIHTLLRYLLAMNARVHEDRGDLVLLELDRRKLGLDERVQLLRRWTHPILLDRAGRVCMNVWPLVQIVPPTDDAEPELSCSMATADKARSWSPRGRAALQW